MDAVSQLAQAVALAAQIYLRTGAIGNYYCPEPYRVETEVQVWEDQSFVATAVCEQLELGGEHAFLSFNFDPDTFTFDITSSTAPDFAVSEGGTMFAPVQVRRMGPVAE